LDPFDKTKTQTAGATTPTDTDTTVNTPMAEEPATSVTDLGSSVSGSAVAEDMGAATVPTPMASQDPVVQTEAPGPEASAPPAPPTADPVVESPPVGTESSVPSVGVSGVSSASEPDETPALGQTTPATEPDESTGGAGGTGLAGE
jgi:hypothetical protein